jgi:hypothetical protein
MAELLPAEREEAFWSGVENARRFFMGEADVHRALERLARVLDEKGIAYAIIEAMALNEWGYRRVTIDVDVLLATEGLRALRTPPPEGSRGRAGARPTALSPRRARRVPRRFGAKEVRRAVASGPDLGP